MKFKWKLYKFSQKRLVVRARTHTRTFVRPSIHPSKRMYNQVSCTIFQFLLILIHVYMRSLHEVHKMYA